MPDPRWTNNEPPTAGTSSEHSEWLNCFDANATRAKYSQHLYGFPDAPFEWTELDVIYPKIFAGLNKSCLYDVPHIYRREVQGAIFVDYPERSMVPNGNFINRGGLRYNHSAPPLPRIWPWIEVMHNPHYGVSTQSSSALWMYIARGSGLWFNPGRVLALSDVWDLAQYLNVTTYEPRHPQSKTILMATAKHMLNTTVDSIAFAFHVDGGCCHRMVMRELVSLRDFSTKCPVSRSFMRRGWPPNALRECNCSSHQHVVQSNVCG